MNFECFISDCHKFKFVIPRECKIEAAMSAISFTLAGGFMIKVLAAVERNASRKKKRWHPEMRAEFALRVSCGATTWSKKRVRAPRGSRWNTIASFISTQVPAFRFAWSAVGIGGRSSLEEESRCWRFDAPADEHPFVEVVWQYVEAPNAACSTIEANASRFAGAWGWRHSLGPFPALVASLGHRFGELLTRTESELFAWLIVEDVVGIESAPDIMLIRAPFRNADLFVRSDVFGAFSNSSIACAIYSENVKPNWLSNLILDLSPLNLICRI